MLYLTSVTHGFRRVAETVRLQFPYIVYSLIVTVKKLFLKAPIVEY